jgi:hypothetical protein
VCLLVKRLSHGRKCSLTLLLPEQPANTVPKPAALSPETVQAYAVPRGEK